MERNFAIVTIFTLLFAVSTARISLDPKPTEAYITRCDTRSLPEDLNNLVALPTETKSRSHEADQKSHNDRMFRVNLTPRSELARFHAINRRFSDHGHFQNPFVTPRSEIGNELILNTRSGKSDPRNFHRHDALSRMKFKHENKRHHQHQHQHHHNHNHHNNDNVSMPKHKFVRENTKSDLFHQKKTREHEASSFMKSIRKFLKHSYE